MSLRIFLVDHEKQSLDRMVRAVEQNEVLELAGVYTDPREALKNIPRLMPDAVFTAVEMPSLNGMALARHIRILDENIQIVFISDRREYALEAFQANAVNYLLKPVTQEDLSITVNRLVKGCRIRHSYGAEPRQLRIRALGGLTVFGDRPDREVRWVTAKSRELFAGFIMNQKSALEKWQLCEQLWPRTSPLKSAHSLHSAINRLRKSLEEAGISIPIFCENGRYRMDLACLSCDAWELQSFLEENPMVNRENIAPCEKALRLYRGDLFGTEDYPWNLSAREKLRAMYLSEMEKAGSYFLSSGNLQQAEEYLLRVSRVDPSNEEAVCLLMRIYAAAGNKEKLARCYADLKTELKKSLGILPKMKTTRLYAGLLHRM